MADEPNAAEAFFHAHSKMKRDLLDFFWDAFTALSLNGISGDYVEFGSDGATSMRSAWEVLRRLPVDRHLWAFDSFAGIPHTADPHDRHPAFSPGRDQGGLPRFLQQCEADGLSGDRLTAVAGFYDDTLPPLGVDGGPSDIALAYVDCNLYSSTVSVLDFLAPRLKHGMVLAFDDYFCWTAEDVSGERIALDEFLAAHPEWNLLRFKDPTWGGASFVVERVDATSPRRRP